MKKKKNTRWKQRSQNKKKAKNKEAGTDTYVKEKKEWREKKKRYD